MIAKMNQSPWCMMNCILLCINLISPHLMVRRFFVFGFFHIIMTHYPIYGVSAVFEIYLSLKPSIKLSKRKQFHKKIPKKPFHYRMQLCERTQLQPNKKLLDRILKSKNAWLLINYIILNFKNKMVCYHGFRETSEEYCKKARDVAEELLKGISKSLGQEENYIHKKMDIESGSQLLVMNLYPPCPRPELVMGMPPHSDHGILTLLMQNDVCGLQILHNGKWVPVNPPPYSFLVNTGDHMEVCISFSGFISLYIK